MKAPGILSPLRLPFRQEGWIACYYMQHRTVRGKNKPHRLDIV